MTPSTMGGFASACVLAGGRGSRLGGLDKLRLRFGEERLLARVVGNLSAHFPDVTLVGARRDALEGLGARVVGDSVEGGGPLAGLHAGLVAARSDWLYLVACDMPFFSDAWARELAGAILEAERAGIPVDVAAAASGPYIEPFHAFYHRRLAGAMEAWIRGAGPGSRLSIQAFLAGRAVLRRPYDAAGDATSAPCPIFVNVNTVEDLRAAEEMARRLDGERHRLTCPGGGDIL